MAARVAAVIMMCRLYCSNRLSSSLSVSVSSHARCFHAQVFHALSRPAQSLLLLSVLLLPFLLCPLHSTRSVFGTGDCVVCGRGSVRRAAE